MNDLHSRTAGGLELRPTRDFPYILKAKFDTEVPPAPPPAELLRGPWPTCTHTGNDVHHHHHHQDGVGLAIGHKLENQRGAWMLAVNYDRRSGPHIGLSFHF